MKKIEELISHSTIEKYSLFNKLIDGDAALAISPSTVRMQQNNDNPFISELSRKLIKNWDDFHECFFDFIIENKESDFELKDFMSHFIPFMMGYEFHENMPDNFWTNKNAIFSEFNGLNLGVSVKKPNGKGYNYIEKIFFPIYKAFITCYKGDGKSWDNDKLEKFKKAFRYEINFLLYANSNDLDGISDSFFFINEKIFKEFSNAIYMDENIDPLKLYDYIKPPKKIDQNQNFVYLVPGIYLSSISAVKNVYKTFEDQGVKSFTKETDDTISQTFDEFYDRFAKVKTEEESEKINKKVKKEEQIELADVLSILGNEDFESKKIEDDLINKIKKATNHSKEAFNQNELKREDQISELLLNYCLKEGENDFKSYRKVVGSGYESDIIVDYSPFQISNILKLNRLKVNEFKEKLENSSNPILEMKSDAMFTNMSKRTITSVVNDVLKAEYIFENKPHFTLEAKVLKEEKELLNLINNNVIPGSKQLDAYINKHKLDPNNSSNKVFHGINIFYIDLEIIPKDIDQRKQKDLYSLSKTHSLKKEINGRTILILAFDKKSPHEYKN